MWLFIHNTMGMGNGSLLGGRVMDITLAPNGTARRTVAAQDVEIPDLWHIAQRLCEEDREAVLQVWHNAHDMRDVLAALPD